MQLKAKTREDDAIVYERDTEAEQQCSKRFHRYLYTYKPEEEVKVIMPNILTRR